MTQMIGILTLIFFCYILIVIKWLLWIPYMIIGFPFTGRWMHEYELPMYPTYWIDTLKAKL